MNQPSKMGKRIVSKAEYIALISKREALRWSSIGMAAATAGLLMCAAFIFKIALTVPAAEGWSTSPVADGWTTWHIAGGVLCLAAAWRVKKMAEHTMQRAQQPLEVLPLTRAITADLPAPESLVRASAEPWQQQKAVLLRAAAQGEKSHHEEQLLKPVG